MEQHRCPEPHRNPSPRLDKRGPAPSLARFGLVFALGVAVLYLLPAWPGAWLGWGAALAGLAALAGRLWLLSALAAGVLWAYLDACAVLCDPFPESLVGQTLVVEGTVTSLPDERDDSVRFLFRVARAMRDGGPIDHRGLVRLSWYDAPPDLLAGERWRLAVRLKPPHGFVNPSGFDYERWLFQQGISATGYVRDDARNRRIGAGPDAHRLARWRQGLRARLLAALEGSGAGRGLIPALVIGERGGITPAQWQVFSRTGTNHLIAISGLHIGLVAGFVFFLARWAWSRSLRLTRRLAAPRAAAVAAMAAAAGYAALAGFAISTQRALVMLAVVMLALIAGRALRPASGLLLALTAVLLLDPASVLSYGFWLSFGAVAALLYALGGRVARPLGPLKWGSAQWAVALGLLPLLLLFFGRASLVAPLVNLLAVPLFGLVLPLVLLAAALELLLHWSLPLLGVAWLLDQGYGLLAWVARWEASSIVLGTRAAWVWMAAFAGVLLLLAPRGLPGRWLGLLLLLPLALMRPAPPAPGEARLTLLDVGQGLAAVVRTHRHTLVYDLGPRYPSGFETGSAVVAPFLRDAGVRQVDVLVASHGDQDHVGGLHGLLADMPVKRVIAGEPDALSGVEAAPCRRGDAWHWDGVDLAMLHPDGAGYAGNDASCVLRVSTAAASVLLPGDVEQGVEAALVAADPDAAAGSVPSLRADILVAAHHGSATSSSARFLAAVDPRWVLYASGYANRWGFPAAVVRERVAALGPAVANTADAGAIELRLPAAGALPAPVFAREQRGRIWRHRPAADPAP